MALSVVTTAPLFGEGTLRAVAAFFFAFHQSQGFASGKEKGHSNNDENNDCLYHHNKRLPIWKNANDTTHANAMV